RPGRESQETDNAAKSIAAPVGVRVRRKTIGRVSISGDAASARTMLPTFRSEDAGRLRAFRRRVSGPAVKDVRAPPLDTCLFRGTEGGIVCLHPGNLRPQGVAVDAASRCGRGGVRPTRAPSIALFE